MHIPREQEYSHADARKEALELVAVPETSEHEPGIAVDINAYTAVSLAEEAYRWLEKNASKYGFILRYPADKVDIAGIRNEPWHFRYVGKETAQEISKRNLCLEGYLISLGELNVSV